MRTYTEEQYQELQDRIKELEDALLPLAQQSDIVNDADCTLWKRRVIAGDVGNARKVLGIYQDED